MKDLDIVYCKDCSSCKCMVVDKNSTVYNCKKNKVFQSNPNLFCNKPCFTQKRFHKKKGDLNGKKS